MLNSATTVYTGTARLIKRGIPPKLYLNLSLNTIDSTYTCVCVLVAMVLALSVSSVVVSNEEGWRSSSHRANQLLTEEAERVGGVWMGGIPTGEGTGVRSWDDLRKRGQQGTKGGTKCRLHLWEVFKFCKTLLPDLLESPPPPVKMVPSEPELMTGASEASWVF